MPDNLKRIKKYVGKGLKAAGLTKTATLTLFTAGTRTPGAIASGTNPTSTAYSVRVTPSQKKFTKVGATLVEQQDRVFLVLGQFLPAGVEPAKSGTLTISGVTYRILDTDVDGAEAAYVCLTRK